MSDFRDIEVDVPQAAAAPGAAPSAEARPAGRGATTMSANDHAPSVLDKLRDIIPDFMKTAGGGGIFESDGPERVGEKVGGTNLADMGVAGARLARDTVGTAAAATLPISMLEAGSIPAAAGVLGRTALAAGKGALWAGGGALAGAPFGHAKAGAELGLAAGGLRGLGGLKGLLSPAAAEGEAAPGIVARLAAALKSHIGGVGDILKPGSSAIPEEGTLPDRGRIMGLIDGLRGKGPTFGANDEANQQAILARLNRAGLFGPGGGAPAGGPTRPDIASTRWTPKSMISGSAHEAADLEAQIGDLKMRMLTGSDAEANAARQEIARLERALTTVGRQAARWAGRAEVR
jgi:hypothetical protein